MIKNLKPKLAEIGRIKTGCLGQERKTRDGKSTYRLPTRLDHYLLTTNERDKTGNFAPNISLMKKIAEKVGESPDHLTTIPVVLLYDDIEDNFYTTYAAYKGRTLMCTGDGEKAIVRNTGEEKSCPCEKLERDYQGPVKCKIYGRLLVVIQDMDILGGVWSLRTTSWNSVQDLWGSMILIKRIAGRLAGIPLTLKLTPKTVVLPTGQTTVYTTTLLYQGSTTALIDTADKIPMIGHDRDVSDQAITPEEESEIQQEFYPPTDADEDQAASVTKQTQGKETEKPEEPAKAKEPTAADLAKKTKQAEDAKKKRQAKAQAQAAAKKKKEDAEIAEAEASKKEATKTTEAEQQTEEPASEAPIEEGEVLDEEPSDDSFGWV